MKMRNAAAVAAHMRSSAGTMKDRRSERRGARNDQREFMEEYRYERGEADYFDAMAEEMLFPDIELD